MTYHYYLERGERPVPPSMKETDLHIRLKMARDNQPIVRLGPISKAA